MPELADTSSFEPIFWMIGIVVALAVGFWVGVKTERWLDGPMRDQ